MSYGWVDEGSIWITKDTPFVSGEETAGWYQAVTACNDDRAPLPP